MPIRKKQKTAQRKGKAKSPSVTTRSTAGPGFAFEDQIGAYLLLQMLMGEALPGSTDSIASRLQTQTKALGWTVDDLLATSDPGASSQYQLAISCKSSHQVTGAGLPKDFVLAAWDQWSKASTGPMSRDRDSIMLATRGYHPAFEPIWADVKNWAAGDSDVALRRIGETAKHRKVFASIRNPVRTRKRTVRDTELVSFVRRLEVMATDFDLANSENRRTAVGRCRTLINGGGLADGRRLWKALVDAARDARLGHGTIELAKLVSDLARDFDLKDHPSYESSWRSLEAATASHKNKIEVTLPGGFAIARQTDAAVVSALIAQEKVTVLYGESGCGKSALVKNILDRDFPEYRQIWLGPDELSVALNELDRTRLNLAHPLPEVLRSSSRSANVLVIDAAERLTREVRDVARQLVASLITDENPSPWRVVIIGQTEAWSESALQAIANVFEPPHHEVALIATEDVEEALQSVAHLSWAASHPDIVAVLRNLRTLAWVLEAEQRFRPQDAGQLASYTAIADRLWQYWTDGQSKFRVQNLLIRLSVREAAFEHSFGISELGTEDAATLDQCPSQTPLRRNNRNRIEFQHDLAAEWARFQRLKEIADQSAQWAAYATQPRWLGALRMLGSYLLRESVSGRPAWDVALEQLESQKNALAADILLDALCLDPLAERFLMDRADLLLRNDGALLNRLLRRFQHIATAPGGSTKLIADAINTDPSYTLYIEAQFRTPILARWPAIARFLHAHRERVAALISPVVSAVCEKWLSSLPVEYAPGVAMPFRREFGEVALATARAVQLEQAKDVGYLGDFAKAIHSAVFAAAPDCPDQISEWALEMARRRPYHAEIKTKVAEYRRLKKLEHEEKLRADPAYRALFERREHLPTSIGSGRRLPPWPLGPQGAVDRQFSECCTNTPALMPLMRSRSKVAAEVLLATIIEGSPEERYDSRFDDGLGLAFDMQSYPTAYWKSPFFSFLQIDGSAALEALISLVNFCTERRASECRRHWPEDPTPELVLNLPEGIERRFGGGVRVFIWSQTDSTHTGQLNSALAALERYLVTKIERGLDVEPDIHRILLTGSSVALLGVLTNVGKSKPKLFLGILRPLIVHSLIYHWDDERLAMNTGIPVQWAQQGDLVLNMAREWHGAPYRQKSMREIIRELARADSDFAAFVKGATTQWQLPDDTKSALEERILAAQLDAENYRSAQDGSLEFALPAELDRDIRTFQTAKASARQILGLPDACRQLLYGRSPLNAETAQRLASMLDTIEAERQLQEETKKRALAAATSLLLVHGSDWLAQNPLVREKVWAIFRSMLAAIPSTMDELRTSQLTRVGILEFAAVAAFAWWTRTESPEAQAAVLKVVTSADSDGIATIFSLAYVRREELGQRWWRLLYLGLLWSALSMLMPRHGYDEDEAARWIRWLGWLRSRRLNDVETTAAKIAPTGIAKRLERVERIRWRREFERKDWRRGSPPEDRRSAGLDWDFLAVAFGWLLQREGGPNPTWSDAAEFAAQRQIIFALWENEVWRNHRVRRDRDDDSVPNQLAFAILATLAKMVAKAPVEHARGLWEPVLKLGAAGHHAVEYFISCWFNEVQRISPSDFVARWQPMIEYALSAPEYGEGRPWYYGQRLLCRILGCRSESLLNRDAAFQPAVQRMHEFYARWAREHLARDEDNVVSLCYFMASPTGHPLRIDGLGWLQRAAAAHSWRGRTENALIEYLNVVMTQDALAVRGNVAAREAFLALVAHLVEKQIPAALALQERARRSFLES
jgi:hypothetical protein